VASREAPAGFVLLLAAACVFYVPTLAAIYGAPEGDPANYSGEDLYSLGWVQFFVVLFGLPLWLALGGMLLSAGRSGRMPIWARGPSAILHIAAAITVWAVTQVYIDANGGVSVIVPALLPPLIAGYAAAMRLPALSERLSPDRVSRIALVAGGVVIALSIPLGYFDLQNLPAHVAADHKRWEAIAAQRQAESDKFHAEEEARFKTLTPDSPLDEYVHFVSGTLESDPEHATALAGARLVKRRQDDAARLLDDGKIYRLREMWQFDLEATPALCAAYDRAFTKLATATPEYDLNVGEDIERQLPNIKFLAGGGCDLNTGLATAEARIDKIIAVNLNDPHWPQLRADLVRLHHS